jgi:hypothetical protein
MGAGMGMGSKAMSAMAARMAAPAGGLGNDFGAGASAANKKLKKHVSVSNVSGAGEKKSLFKMVAQG